MASAASGGAGGLSCDYVVVGAGASGMSFVDTLLKHHPNMCAHRRALPWFVRGRWQLLQS